MKAKEQESWTPRRDQAYLGVLIDDLITKGVTEPYRMFTSRAEFRLQLREDNADARLTEKAHHLGLIDEARWVAFQEKQEAVSRETQRLKSLWVNPKNIDQGRATAVLGHEIEREYNLADLMRRPGVGYHDVLSLDATRFESDALAHLSSGVQAEVIEQIDIAAKYSGYIDRQKEEVKRAEHYERLVLPNNFDYMGIEALSYEVRQKLQRHQPQTLGLASRISGVTPAAISLLLIHLKKQRLKMPEDPESLHAVNP